MNKSWQVSETRLKTLIEPWQKMNVCWSAQIFLFFIEYDWLSGIINIIDNRCFILWSQIKHWLLAAVRIQSVTVKVNFSLQLFTPTDPTPVRPRRHEHDQAETRWNAAPLTRSSWAEVDLRLSDISPDRIVSTDTALIANYPTVGGKTSDSRYEE